MNDLEWLADWYMSNCNGEWEEYYGIKIQTIDNPDKDWMDCKVEGGKYIGVGDKTKLSEIINIFRNWSKQ